MKPDDFARALYQRLNDVRTAEGQVTRERWLGVVASQYALAQEPKTLRLVGPKAKAEPKPPKPRNVLFDRLASLTGTKNVLEMTKAGAKEVGIALAQILAVTPELTVAELEARAAEFKRKHRDWTMTAMHLAKRWGEVGKGERTESAKKDPYVEPGNWRPVAFRLWPDALDWVNPHDWRSIRWLSVDLTLRQKILAA